MLQSIRSTVGSWVVKILFVLLIASFAFWGAGDVTRSFSPNVAEVGDESITPQELDQEFRRELNRLRQVLGPEVTEQQAIQLGVLDRTLQQLIQRALLTEAAADMGLRVGDQTVVQEVQDIPAFRNAFGRFDPDLMRAVLRENGFTEQTFVEQLRGDLARTQVLQAVGAGATAPTALAEALYRFRGERRVADAISIPASAMPAPPAPDDATLAAYHEANSVRYTAPEYRTFAVASLTAETLMDEVTISEADLEEGYAARSADYITPERRAFAQVVAADEATAKTVAEAVAGGQSLEQAAQTAGLDVITFEPSSREDLLPELAEPVFSAEAGKLAGPVETPLGWHVLTVTDVQSARERTLDEVKEELTATLRREKAVDRLFEVANAMDDAVAGGASLEEAAGRVGAAVTRVDQVDVQGNRPDGTAVSGVPALQTVLERGFALQNGETSNLVETEDQGYVAVEVLDVQPAALKPLDSIREQVAADWAADQRRQAAAAKAEEVAAKLRDGADPAQVAAEIPGAAQTRTAPLLRGQRGAPVPGGVLEDLFEQPVGGVVTGAGEDGHVVARLAEIVPADPNLGAGQIAQIRAATERDVANDLIEQYLTALRGRYDVTENRSAMDQMYRPQE